MTSCVTRLQCLRSHRPKRRKALEFSDLLPLPNLEKWAIWKLFSEKNMFTPKTRIQNVFKLYKDHVGMLEIAWK